MNTIEVMLEAVESAQSLLRGLDYADGPVYQQLTKAIALGEAELRREPELCAVCGEGKASLIVLRTCDNCNSEYAGKYEMDLAKKLREEIK
jgi:hypothetical protein